MPASKRCCRNPRKVKVSNPIVPITCDILIIMIQFSLTSERKARTKPNNVLDAAKMKFYVIFNSSYFGKANFKSKHFALFQWQLLQKVLATFFSGYNNLSLE